MSQLLDDVEDVVDQYYDLPSEAAIRMSAKLEEEACALLARIGPQVWPDDPVGWLLSTTAEVFDGPKGLYPRDLYFSRQEDRIKYVSKYTRRVYDIDISLGYERYSING